jgi:glycosyltransferase involved in cell wall biosynthesis
MKIAYVHPDAEGREKEVAEHLYPKNQLWGADLLQAFGHEVQIIPTKCSTIVTKFGELLNKLTGKRLSDFHIELQVLFQSRGVELVYAPSGHLLLLPLLRRLGLFQPKIVTWFFRLPDCKKWWSLRTLRFARYVLNGFDGILCLTQKAASDFKKQSDDPKIESLPWFADSEIFSPEIEGDTGNYFLAVGKTRRDYATLLEACSEVDAPFRIIAPKEVAQQTPIPPNVKFVETSSDPPDAAISYKELRDWYANSVAVLIPLIEDEDDTSGYTSMLEAIQMGKPIIMTRSGCLDLDVEELGIGTFVQPGDSESWVAALKHYRNQPPLPSSNFKKARNLYNSENFGKLLNQFLLSV